MGNFYQDKCYIRERNPQGKYKIERDYEWIWPRTDTGAWDGPMQNWEDHHHIKFFANLKNTDLAIQAGGCMGMYPRLLAERFTKVYTFEPCPLAFYCLSNNCQSDNIIKFQAALGDRTGFCMTDGFCESNMGANRITETMGYTPMIKIDSLELPNCDLISLDVEGYEDRILRGAAETIRKYGPKITVENGQRQEIKNFMEEFGYRDVETSAMDTVFIKR